MSRPPDLQRFFCIGGTLKPSIHHGFALFATQLEPGLSVEVDAGLHSSARQASLLGAPHSCANAGLVLQDLAPEHLCERRVTDDVLELDLLGIEQLQPEVVVAVRPVQDEARGEEAELV